MSATLNWEMRTILKELRQDGRLAVLTALMLHANLRMRCFPSIDLLVEETGWSVASVTAAKAWLAECGAFVLVPHDKRVDEEIDLPIRQHVYQLTGILQIEDRTYAYLHLPPEALEAIKQSVSKTLASKVLASKTLASKTKGSSISKGVSKKTRKKGASIPRRKNPLFDAVSWAWNNKSPGYVGKLMKFLNGTCQPKDGKYFEWQIAKALTPQEVIGFRMWRDHEQLPMPKVPETMQRTIEEFRGIPEYERIMERAIEKLVTLGPQPTHAPVPQPAVLETPKDMNAVIDSLAEKFGG